MNSSSAQRRIEGFPWPFDPDERTFRYSVNVADAKVPRQTATGSWGANIIDIDDDYLAIVQARDNVLRADPGRCAVLPHMLPATWDLMLTLMRELVDGYPEVMHLDEVGTDGWRWRNDLLGIDRTFVFGDLATLPEGPLEFIGRQVPDDLLLVSEREGQLWLDAGLVTFANAWSVKFDVGMNFHEIHGPVPRLTGEGTTKRAQRFMMMMTGDRMFRRVNWTFSSIGSRRMDASLETYDRWGWEKTRIVNDEDWGRVQLRVELEHFIRLPLTGALVFNIRTYMLSLAEIATVPEWADQLADIVEELPADIGTYKGFADWGTDAMRWLRAQSHTDAAAPAVAG
ncbi:heme-dependent oxidative N-demethylase family protein [Pseudoclavibacter soli]|uniref:heme-dependent oxidative N-demethylase family protein n=1 Tax=Pseudoclavibacter soli TaxID=452623 RepID=UPI000409CF1D|nr:DUF3445 domain-containing protein [Pseudoclavibacter soli]